MDGGGSVHAILGPIVTTHPGSTFTVHGVKDGALVNTCSHEPSDLPSVLLEGNFGKVVMKSSIFLLAYSSDPSHKGFFVLPNQFAVYDNGRVLLSFLKDLSKRFSDYDIYDLRKLLAGYESVEVGLKNLIANVTAGAVNVQYLNVFSAQTFAHSTSDSDSLVTEKSTGYAVVKPPRERCSEYSRRLFEHAKAVDGGISYALSTLRSMAMSFEPLFPEDNFDPYRDISVSYEGDQVDSMVFFVRFSFWSRFEERLTQLEISFTNNGSPSMWTKISVAKEDGARFPFVFEDASVKAKNNHLILEDVVDLLIKRASEYC